MNLLFKLTQNIKKLFAPKIQSIRHLPWVMCVRNNKVVFVVEEDSYFRAYNKVREEARWIKDSDKNFNKVIPIKEFTTDEETARHI